MFDKYIENIEDKQKITVLALYQIGSRADGIFNSMSDYDYGGIYVKTPVSRYLSLKPGSETYHIQDGKIDIQLYDIKKVMKLLIKNNYSIIEWIMSEPVFETEKFEEVKKIILHLYNEYFVPEALFMHARGIGKAVFDAKRKQQRNKRIAVKSAMIMKILMVEEKPILSFNINSLWENLDLLDPSDFSDSVKEYIETKKMTEKLKRQTKEILFSDEKVRSSFNKKDYTLYDKPLLYLNEVMK